MLIAENVSKNRGKFLMSKKPLAPGKMNSNLAGDNLKTNTKLLRGLSADC